MLIEAFACGVPVVASDSGEIPHVVADAGILVREDDREAWTRLVSAMLSDAGMRDDFGRRGRSRAESTFAWPVVARQHLAFLEELAA
jgi:glycosyltransferase involved in cell wall biosynthesis